MEYGYSGVYDNSKVRMLMNGIDTNDLDACKAPILAGPDMQGDFDIEVRHSHDFIAMTPSLQKNATFKVYSMNISGGVRGGGSGSDCGSGMPAESNVQYAMSAIKILLWI